MVRLLAVKEVGERLGVSVMTVFRLFEAGTLQGIVLAQGSRKRLIKFRPEAVEQFLRRREQAGRTGGQRKKGEVGADAERGTSQTVTRGVGHHRRGH